MSGPYRYFLAQLTTGQIWEEIELVNVSAERSLTMGGFSANLDLESVPANRRRNLILRSAPARCSVVIMQDGNTLGEWIIWKRTRTNAADPINLTGAELLSYLDHRLLGPMTFTQVEQLDIARDIFNHAVGGTYPAGAGAVAATVAPYSPSGRLRDRTYKIAEAFNGQRLKELSEVIDGFDYYTTSAMTVSSSGAGSVARQLQLKYPRAGNDSPLVFWSPGYDNSNGNVVNAGIAEDGTQVASEAWALGGTYQSGGVEYQTMAASSDYTLINQYGYPYLQASGSYTSVTIQSTIQGHADALLDAHQDIEIPSNLTVVLDKNLTLAMLGLGDRVTLNIAPSVNFPDGRVIPVRIMGWTLKPPSAGPDVIDIHIVKE